MRNLRMLLPAACMLGALACGEREPPPPEAAAAAPSPTADTAAPMDTLRGDSVMARDTARMPQ